MARIRKVKRRQKYRYQNRGTLKKKNKNRKPVLDDKVKAVWDEKKSVKANMMEMGLVYDVNEVPSSMEEVKSCAMIVKKTKKTSKGSTSCGIIEEMEKEANAPKFEAKKLPSELVSFVTHLIKNYGDDYKAMAKDHKNHYQDTWKQIKAKVKKFKKLYEFDGVRWTQKSKASDTAMDVD